MNFVQITENFIIFNPFEMLQPKLSKEILIAISDFVPSPDSHEWHVAVCMETAVDFMYILRSGANAVAVANLSW